MSRYAFGFFRNMRIEYRYRMDRQCCPVETPRGNPPGGFHLKMVEPPHSLAIMTLGLQMGGFHLAEVETPHL